MAEGGPDPVVDLEQELTMAEGGPDPVVDLEQELTMAEGGPDPVVDLEQENLVEETENRDCESPETNRKCRSYKEKENKLYKTFWLKDCLQEVLPLQGTTLKLSWWEATCDGNV